ncbi:MAG: cellulose binding domain-containing protein, partial [Pseudomonadota bacterium]
MPASDTAHLIGGASADMGITAGTATSVIESQWSSGFVAQLVFAAEDAVNSWTLQFEMNADITNIWNAEIVSKEGNLYTVKNVGFNGNLSAGGEASFGFQAAGSDSTITFRNPA